MKQYTLNMDSQLKLYVTLFSESVCSCSATVDSKPYSVHIMDTAPEVSS